MHLASICFCFGYFFVSGVFFLQSKVLIAVGDRTFTNILKDTFERHKQVFLLSSQEIFHRRFLTEIVDIEKPDILILHDYYLESDLTQTEQKEQEMLTFIRNFRVQYNDALRIVYLCERPRGDIYLTKLVSLGVLDIFNSNSIDLDEFITQLEQKPLFSNVEKFLVTESIEPIVVTKDSKTDKEEEDHQQEKTQRPIIQKVVEKKVIQKVVNKNVIKRDYKIQITNQTEKVIGVPIKKKLILIGSPFSRSGSTFVSHLLARALTQMGVPTTYIESPYSKAYTFDRYYGGYSTGEYYRSKFYQFCKPNDSKVFYEYDWKKDDVELVCKHPIKEDLYEEKDITFEHLIKILFSSQSLVTIMDVGADWQYGLYQDAIDIADHMYMVIEPDISYIQHLEESDNPNVEFFRANLQNEKLSIIGNRFDKNIMDHPIFHGLYEDRLITYIPSFPVSDVFQVQMQGIFLNDYKEYRKKLEPSIQPLIEDILPAEFIQKNRKNQGLLKGLFKKKITINKTESKGENITV